MCHVPVGCLWEVQVLAQGLWRCLCGHFAAAHHLFVRSTLAESFGNVSRALKASTEALDSFGLTQGQLEALLSAVRHMADQRVQDIGATVSAALASYFKVEGADAGKEAARQRAYGEKEME